MESPADKVYRRWHYSYGQSMGTHGRYSLGEAIQELADEVVPHREIGPQDDLIWGMERKAQIIRQQLLSIAKELSGEEDDNCSPLLRRVAIELPRVPNADGRLVLNLRAARHILTAVGDELFRKAEGHLASGTYWADWIRSQAE